MSGSSGTPTLTLIWAMGENRVIGRDGGLPWNLPKDLAHFQRTTRGHTVVMGRRTFESVGEPLRDRTNIVLSRDPEFRAPGAVVARDLDDALRLVPTDEREVFVVGGAQVYREALPRADRLVVTLVHAAPAGDTRFPELDLGGFRLVAEQHHQADEHHAHAFDIRVYERR